MHTGRLRDNPEQAILPLTLRGRSLGLEEGGELTQMDFTANGNVVITHADGTVEISEYRYEVKTASTAELRVEYGSEPGGRPYIYNLILEIEAAGTTSRLPQLRGGGVPPGAKPQLGNFNLPNPATPTNSVSGPPKSLEGKVIQINGEDPVTLNFSNDGTGTATREKDGSVEMTPFTYDYAATGTTGASLALTFPGAQDDRVEDYDLDFSGTSEGSFQSSTYEGGELASSSTGNFNTGGS